jgi:hypothetical protein
MGLADIVRNGVALANRLTADLQAEVTHEAWTGQDDTGAPTYASAKTRTAIVERRQRLRRSPSGQELMSRHVVAFLAPIAANGAADRQEPIDPRDRITLPDGSTGPIIDVVSTVDSESATGHGYMYEVYLG